MNSLRIVRRMFPIFLAIVVLSAISVSVWAKNDANDSVSATIRLSTAAKIGSTQLAPGEYKIVVEGSQAKIQKGNKVVAEVPCTLKDISFTPQATSFVVDNDSISEIQVSGRTKAIEFSPGQ